MTFQAYQRALRLGTALQEIRDGRDLTGVGLGHGYDSSSGFRDAFERTFGQTPGRSRDATCVVTQTLESPIGPLIVCATPTAICLLEFTDRRALETQVATLRSRFDCAIVPGTNEVIEQLRDELTRYFAGDLQDFRVPLEYPGTPFQRAVWQRLLRIPFGQTISYERLARDVGRPGAQRGRDRQRPEPPRHRDPLSPRGQQERPARRLRRRTLAETVPAGPGTPGRPGPAA